MIEIGNWKSEIRQTCFLLLFCFILLLGGCVSAPKKEPLTIPEDTSIFKLPDDKGISEVPVPVYHELKQEKLSQDKAAKSLVVIWTPTRWANPLTCAEFLESHPEVRVSMVFPETFFDDNDKARQAQLIFKTLVLKGQIEPIMDLPAKPVLSLLFDTDLAITSTDTVSTMRYAWPQDIAGHLTLARNAYGKRWRANPNILWLPKGDPVGPELPYIKDMKLKGVLIGHKRHTSGYFDAAPLTLIRPAIYPKTSAKSRKNWFFRWRAKSTEKTARHPIRVSSVQDIQDIKNKSTSAGGDHWALLSEVISAPVPFPSWDKADKAAFNYHHWIGEPEENMAWSLLEMARTAVEDYKNSEQAKARNLDFALREIYNAQSSRYFYYFGNDHDSGHDTDLKRKFLATLTQVYRLMGQPVPSAIRQGFSASVLSAQSHDKNRTIFKKTGNALSWKDAVKDDRGPGHFFYPTGKEYLPGSWDLCGFHVVPHAAGVWFEFDMGSLSNTWNAPHGFSFPLIDVYIDINRLSGAGAENLLPGRPGLVEAQNAWEYALTVDGWGADLYQYHLQSREKKIASFPVKIVSPSRFQVRVPGDYLRGEAASWGFGVVVMGNLPPDQVFAQTKTPDLKKFTGRIPMPVAEEAGPFQFGGAKPAKHQAPPFMDLLVPVGQDQSHVLSVYEQERAVVIPFVRAE